MVFALAGDSTTTSFTTNPHAYTREGGQRGGGASSRMLTKPDRRWHSAPMADLHPMLAQVFERSRAGRNDEALLILNKLAGEGEREALWVLGDLHWRGFLVSRAPPHGR